MAVPEGNTPVTEPQSAFEKAIILRATSMAPGNIATNWEEVLAAVKEKSEQYQDVTKYEGDEKQAKDDRALLRKQKDMTKTTIVSIEEAWNEPLKPFLVGGRAILKQFDYAIEAIDTWVKEGEGREEEKKRREIQAYFDGKDFDLVSLDLFFNARWLNKGYKIPEIKKEIDAKIAEIYSNIKILENISEYGMTVKSFYLETLNMGLAMIKVETLKANAEKLAREQANRETRQAEEQVAHNASAERKEERAAVREERMESLVDDALDIEPPAVPAGPEIMEFTLQFKGTKEQLLKLREYMTSQGIPYEKLAIFDDDGQADQFMRQNHMDGRIYSAVFVAVGEGVS
jgi:hypothetical protein